MTLNFIFILMFSGLILAENARAVVLFEAFYRIEKEGRHTGYVIQRMSSEKNGMRVLTSYIRSKYENREIYLTSKTTVSGVRGTPVETVHSSNPNTVPSTILARFKKGKGTITYYSNHSPKANLTETEPAASYPSAFLFYLADFEKFQLGQKYSYKAFFEESGRTQLGQLSVLSVSVAAGKRVFQVLNDDSGQPVENFIGEKGEPLGSRSISTGTVAFWVATKEEAVGDMTYPTGEMTALFGELPVGKKNEWSKTRGLRPMDLIKGFKVWDGLNTISLTSSAPVSPMPVRDLP